MSMQSFDATNELENLRRHCGARRKSHYQRSRLNKWRAELVAFNKAGASLREIALWLRKNKRINISHSTIMRYLKKLPELKAIQSEGNVIEDTTNA